MTDLSIQPGIQPLQTRLELEKDDLVRIIGPARIFVADGCIRILGLDICKGGATIINRYRSYCVKALSRSVVNIALGEGGSIERPNPGEEVINEWEAAAKAIVDRGGVALILGPVESGKTSFSTLLSNIALDVGKKPCVVDADVGQGDLAPPTFIGMKCLDKKVLWLRDEKGDYLKFVGSVTPSHSSAMTKVVVGAVELVSKAKILGGDIVIVNTDGWFGDTNSIEYKYTLAKALSPSSIVVLGQDYCTAFETMFRNSAIVYCLPRPRAVKERSASDRRDLRKVNYQKWFSNMRKICVDINSIALSGTCILGGSALPSGEITMLEKTLGVKIMYASRYSDLDVIMVPDNAMIPREAFENLGRRTIVVKPSNAKGVIAAITDKNLNEIGVGIIDEIDLNSGRLCILTESPKDIGGIIFGKIKLDDQWNDNIRYQKCVI
uniref:polynucleotide 5'-hydroxyl-kinase n=1 Tax=Ignisphaera aggregans TaxID=334771 RepID=A0A7C2ZP56_9CREN